MRLGVVFPQTEIGSEAGAVRAYGEAVADVGFDHVLAYDHVLGTMRDSAAPRVRPRSPIPPAICH